MTGRLSWTEVKLLTREPLVLAFSLAFPVTMMVLLLLSFGGEVDPVFAGGDATVSYVTAYLAAAIAVLGYMGTPTHIAAYRENGVLRRFRAAGIPSPALIGSQGVVMAALAVVGAAVQLGIAATGFELSAPASLAGVAVAFVIGILAFAAIGTLLGTLLPSARAAQGIGLVLFFGTFFLVGGGPPAGVLPSVVTAIAAYTPTGLLVDSIRSPWLGEGPDVVALGLLLTIAVVGAVLAIRRLGRM